MREITITELQKRAGAAIDDTLREGQIVVVRYGNPVAILSAKAPTDTEIKVISATAFWKSLPGCVDDLSDGAFGITRRGRKEPTVYLCQVNF